MDGVKHPSNVMKKGLELTEYIGAVIDNQATICHGPTVQAVQNVGYPLMSLGEVKNRADIIVYTGSNPMNTHPRHLARYTTFPRGWFRPRGRFDRKLVDMGP